MKNTRGGYLTSMDEVQRHIDKLKYDALNTNPLLDSILTTTCVIYGKADLRHNAYRYLKTNRIKFLPLRLLCLYGNLKLVVCGQYLGRGNQGPFIFYENSATPKCCIVRFFSAPTSFLSTHYAGFREKFGSFHHASYRTSYDCKKPYIAGRSAVKPPGQVGGPSKPTAKSASAAHTAKDATAPSGGGVASKKAPVKLSIVSKTASAVKSKYNSIITTRRAKALAAGAESGSGQLQAVRSGSRRGKVVATSKTSRVGRAKVADSCRSAFEMSDISALHREVATMRPLVSLTRLSPDILRPLNGQDSIVNKIESSIKKRDAQEAADSCTESPENEESQTGRVVNAKQQYGGEKGESGTEQVEREKSPASEAKQQSCVQKDESVTVQKERENSPAIDAGKPSTVPTAAAPDVVSPESCLADESAGRENAAAATPHETDSCTTPAKKNQSLESLVETCKAKLRENADEVSVTRSVFPR